MRIFALALATLMSGCSLMHTPDWLRSDNGQTNAPSDVLESCREQARAMIRRDQTIDQDIGGQATNSDMAQGMGDLNRNLDQYSTNSRYERIVEDCMKARGYGGGGTAGTAPVQVEGLPPTPEAPPPPAPQP